MLEPVLASLSQHIMSRYGEKLQGILRGKTLLEERIRTRRRYVRDVGIIRPECKTTIINMLRALNHRSRKCRELKE